VSFNLYLSPLSLFGFLITIATAFRLSKFNLMKTKKTHFVGLPAPANCTMILGLPFIFDFLGENYLNYSLLFIIILFSIFMLNSKIKLISLKNINISVIILFSCFTITTLIISNFAILTIIILTYILMSLVYFKSRT
jgi:CDP-diacylglycerol--serine O-phosphatidyltransferase